MIDELINSSFEFDFELYKKNNLFETLNKLLVEFKKKVYRKDNANEIDKYIGLIIELFTSLNELLTNCDARRIVLHIL